MSGKEAKETLEAIGGLLFLIQVTCFPKNDSGQFEQFKQLFGKYEEAVKVAKDAIDIMDNKLSIEGKEN